MLVPPVPEPVALAPPSELPVPAAEAPDPPPVLVVVPPEAALLPQPAKLNAKSNSARVARCN